MNWLRAIAHRTRVEAHATWIAARDPRTPWFARGFGWLIAAYALSPIDLIPDFVPIIGLLDDAILLPLGIWLFRRMVPAALFEEFRARAEAQSARPISRAGAVIILSVWAAAAGLIAAYVWSWRYW
jgi:uncharacterized membrane protein YkvA (DUF1232 family)